MPYWSPSALLMASSKATELLIGNFMQRGVLERLENQGKVK